MSEREKALEEALRATRKELAHWIAWANEKAMRPQREKGDSVLQMADVALALPATPDPRLMEEDVSEGYRILTGSFPGSGLLEAVAVARRTRLSREGVSLGVTITEEKVKDLLSTLRFTRDTQPLGSDRWYQWNSRALLVEKLAALTPSSTEER